jgi:hypothetical protein
VSYAGLALLAATFLKTQVAPCLGGQIAAEATARCVAAWQAQRPFWDTMFDTPLGALVIFAALIAVTWLVLKFATRRPGGGEWRVS